LADLQVIIPPSENEMLSPAEIKKRNIMFAVFNTCISMLLNLQNTVSTQAQNVNFYTNWQQQLTNEMSGVPTYVGGESSAVHVDTNDLNKFTIGYDNISIANIAQWWANQIATGSATPFIIGALDTNFTSGTGSTITFNPPSGGNPGNITITGLAVSNPSGLAPGTYSLSLTPPATNTAQQNAQYFENQFLSWWNGTASVTQTTFNFPFGYNVTQVNTSLPSILSNILTSPYGNPNSSLTGLATGLLNNTLSTQALISAGIFTPTNASNDPNAALEVLKPYTYVSPSNVTATTDPRYNLSSSNAKSRAEINSRDQQFIENIRSNRQTVQNITQTMQTNLNQSQQELSQQTDLITSITTSLQGLISSIFR
jgi:hypothetical protein